MPQPKRADCFFEQNHLFKGILVGTLTRTLKESPMLVLTRKLGESIAIDDHIKIRVVQIKGKQVRLGIEAPRDTKIHREEVYLAIQDQNQQSVNTDSEKTRQVAKLLKS